ncbi:hypothetical protein Q3G72_017355 [Acer saccharum]|nr:hypothetical protein Q3G72_017355 [Acer saccharum]
MSKRVVFGFHKRFKLSTNHGAEDIMRNQVVEEKFVEFCKKWVTQHDENLQLLLRASREQSLNEAEQQALVSRMTTHIKEYYTVKWAMAREDVLVFYNPVWISTLESGCFWYTGWKPSSVFRLVESIKKKWEVGPRLDDLTELQAKKIEELRLRIRLEEEKVDRDMERQQVTLADRKMMELSRLAARFRREGDSTSAGSKHVDGLVGIALKSLMNGLEKVMKTADCVRLKTMKGILDNLNSKQSIEFLAANSMQLEGNHKRTIRSREDVDAPLQSGIVRVFEQPGIEAPSDEDDFIEVRSKRQMLNDRREQREKEIKAKSQVTKMPRKLRPTSHSTFVSASSNNASGFIFDSKNNVQTSMGSWGNLQLNQQLCDAIGVYLTV